MKEKKEEEMEKYEMKEKQMKEEKGKYRSDMEGMKSRSNKQTEIHMDTNTSTHNLFADGAKLMRVIKNTEELASVLGWTG